MKIKFLAYLIALILFPINVVETYDTDLWKYDILVAVVTQEGGTDYDNALWVMSTIKNRMKDERFPEHWYEVITQEGQFEAYSSGEYRKHLDNPNQDVIRAIEDVLRENSVHDYLFFLSDSYAQSVGRQGESHGGNTYFKEW